MFKLETWYYVLFHRYAIKVNFHQFYRFIVQLFSSWNEFNDLQSTQGRCAPFVVPDLSNFGSYCSKISLFLPNWWNKYYFTWRRCLLQREFYIFNVVCNKRSWEIRFPQEKNFFIFVVAYVWRCREMTRTNWIKNARFVQSKGSKSFSSKYASSFAWHC